MEAGVVEAGSSCAAAARETASTGKQYITWMAMCRMTVSAVASIRNAEIALLGPEEPACRIHSADESVSLDELERCILAEALTLAGMADVPVSGGRRE